jgi:hypothetical protein
MLQKVLSDRFKLAVHQQSKELSGFVLMTGKGAPKLKAVEGTGEGNMTGAALSFEGHAMTMSRLANILDAGLKIPVIDNTGLDGHYDVKLDMRPYLTARQPGDLPLDLMGISDTAVQEQLGLKLEARKMAGCTAVEHGLGASDDDLRLMTERGVFFDPQAGLFVDTLLRNKDRYLGTPLFNEATFAGLEGILLAHHEFMRGQRGFPASKLSSAKMRSRASIAVTPRNSSSVCTTGSLLSTRWSRRIPVRQRLLACPTR